MSRHIAIVLIFSLTLLAGACSNQSAFEPSQPTLTGSDQRHPSFSGGSTGGGSGTDGAADDPEPRKSPGGSRGGWKK